MRMSNQAAVLIRLVLAAVSAALVFIATTAFSIYVPLTRGFFNIGETMIYAMALLFGPLIGSFAGGVGASLADVYLGYWYFAPATLVIKACEGAIVGLLGHGRPSLSPKLWKTFTFVLGLIIGALLATIGSLYYTGVVQLSIGLPPPATPNVNFYVPTIFWYLLGAAAILLITLAGFILNPEAGWPIFPMLIGGSVMVVGYYLYERFLLFPLFGIAVIAEPEIPINVGQMIIGLAVALPIVRFVGPSVPQLSRIKTRLSRVARQ
jgi:uncharacterized membrane protein